MACWNCEGLGHPSRLCPTPSGAAKTGSRCGICNGFGHVAQHCTSKGGGKYTEPPKGGKGKGAGDKGGKGYGGNGGSKGYGKGKGWGKSTNFYGGKGKGMSAFDAWPGQEFWGGQGGANAGAPSTPPWMQQPPGLYSMGNWGDSSQGWQTYGQPGGIRQVSSLAKKFTPTTTSNRYDALLNVASDKVDIAPNQEMIKPTIFDKIVWRNEDVRRKRRKNVDNKSDDYLFNGKTFSLDNYVKMQEREVGRDLNLGGKISASRTKGTEDFDKHFPKVDVDISTTSQANVAQDMLFDSVDHESDVLPRQW